MKKKSKNLNRLLKDSLPINQNQIRLLQDVNLLKSLQLRNFQHQADVILLLDLTLNVSLEKKFYR